MARSARTTLNDIANATGLSVSSVSRALHNSHQISEAQKRQVLDAARALDYRKHLRRPTPAFLTIAVYAKDIDLNAHGSTYQEIYDAIREEARLHGCRVINIGLGDLDALVAEPDCRFEALILLGFDREEYFGPLAETARPIVLVNSQDPYGRLDSVLPDNLGCGALVARYLEEQGHGSTLHIVHRQRLTIQRRLDGYFQLRREKRVDLPRDKIIDPGSFEESDIEAIKTNIADALDGVACSDFDSVVCWGILMRLAFSEVAPQSIRALPIVSVDYSAELDSQQNEGAIVHIPERRLAGKRSSNWCCANSIPMRLASGRCCRCRLPGHAKFAMNS